MVPNSLRLNIFVWCKLVVQFHAFAGHCPVFPTLFFEETVLSLLYILGSFVIINCPFMCGFNSVLYSFPLICIFPNIILFSLL